MAFRTMLRGKIHRATVTQCDLNYVGSITIDADLLRAANILPGEQVHVVNVTTGARLETYTIAGPSGSGVIGINGAAARLAQVGDIIIVIAYALVPDAEAPDFEPHIVLVDRTNRIIHQGSDAAFALPDSGLLSGSTTQ